MTKFYLLLFSIVIWTTVHSQNFEWLNQIHVTNPDGIGGRAMDLDNDGNLIIAGMFRGGVIDFDQSAGVAELNSLGNIYDDLFVMKVDQNGNFIWANRFGGPDSEAYKDVTVDDQNNIYTTGTFRQAVDFLPSVPSGYRTDVFVQKLDPTGNQVWAGHFKGVDTDHAGNVSVDSQGNVYVSGKFRDSVDFDPGINEYFLHANSFGSGRRFIVKLDSTGAFQWAQNFGPNNGANGPGSMQVDSNDDVVICGSTYSKLDFDLGPDTLFLGEYSKSCGFVIKIDSAGDLIWGKDFCPESYDGNFDCRDLTIDPLDNIVLIGSFHDSIDFNPNVGEDWLFGASYEDLFILNLTSTGDFNWAKRIGTPTSNPNIAQGIRGFGITSDLIGNIYATGYISDSTDFDGGVTDFILDAGYSMDQFILKYDNTGEFGGVFQIEGNEQLTQYSEAEGYDIRIGQNDQIYTTGTFGQEVDFDPGIGEHMAGQLGYRGVFILALNQFELSIQGLDANKNYIFPNPTSDYIYFDQVVESIILLNASGQLISVISNDQFVDLSAQPSGMYTLLLDGKPHRVIRR